MSLLLFYPSAGAPAEILGSAALTEAADTLATVGVVALQATASHTEAGDTIAATGALTVAGLAAITEGEDSAAASALLALVGSSDCLESDDMIAIVMGGNYAHATVLPAVRMRRRPMRWMDTEGNEVDLMIDEGGGRHLMVRPTGKKPYKPVRGIRFRRD